MAALGELILGGLWMWGGLPLVTVLALHIALVALLAVLLVRFERLRHAFTPIALISLAFLGPPGAFGILLLGLVLAFSRPDAGLLDAWQQRLTGTTQQDDITLLFQIINNGRALANGKVAATGDGEQDELTGIQHFKTVIETGSTRDKQAVLGIVALKYHPTFFTVLERALNDAEPSIRVQAAAAHAKLRMRFASSMKEALSKTTGPQQAHHSRAHRIVSLDEAVRSQFLTPLERQHCRAKIMSLGDAVSAPHQTPPVLLIIAENLIIEKKANRALEILAPLLDMDELALEPDADAHALNASAIAARALELTREALVLERRFEDLADLADGVKPSPAGPPSSSRGFVINREGVS